MIFLLSFNLLTKRLYENVYLLGKVLKFMGFVVGIESRSSFNIGGNINKYNEIINDIPKNLNLRKKVYKILWSVIKICLNPNQLIDKNMNWCEFRNNINTVLKDFEHSLIHFNIVQVDNKIFLVENFVYPKYVIIFINFKFHF